MDLLELVRSGVEYAVTRFRDNVARGVVYVTDVSTCLRRAYFDVVLGYRVTKVMEGGKHAHEETLARFCEYVRSRGHSCEYEVPVSTTVEGRCMVVQLDGRVDAVIDNRIIVELKFSNRVHDHHVRQCEYYAWMMGADRYIICLVKDSGDIECVLMKRRVPDEALVSRIDALTCAVLDREPPKPEPGPWCSNCPHKPMCAASRKLTEYLV